MRPVQDATLVAEFKTTGTEPVAIENVPVAVMLHKQDNGSIGSAAPPGLSGAFHPAGVADNYPQVIDLEQDGIVLPAKLLRQGKYLIAKGAAQDVGAKYLVSPLSGIQTRVGVKRKAAHRSWRGGGRGSGLLSEN